MLTRDEIWNALHDVVAEIVESSGIESEDILPSTMMSADLNLTSVDTIHMIISLEEKLGEDLDMESLVMKDGVYIADLSLGDLQGFICQQLGVA